MCSECFPWVERRGRSSSRAPRESYGRGSLYSLFPEHLRKSYVDRRSHASMAPLMPANYNEMLCPLCGEEIQRRNTWRGLLCAILLFPFGLYCCLKNREKYCQRCKCTVVQAQLKHIRRSLGYKYREWTSVKGRLPASYMLKAPIANGAVRNEGATLASDTPQQEGSFIYQSSTDTARHVIVPKSQKQYKDSKVQFEPQS